MRSGSPLGLAENPGSATGNSGTCISSGGSRISSRGGVDSESGYVLKILYVETKESGPLGGVRRARPLDPPMFRSLSKKNTILFKALCSLLY